MTPYLPIVFIIAAFAAGICVVLAVGMIVLGRQTVAEKIERRIGLEEAAGRRGPGGNPRPRRQRLVRSPFLPAPGRIGAVDIAAGRACRS